MNDFPTTLAYSRSVAHSLFSVFLLVGLLTLGRLDAYAQAYSLPTPPEVLQAYDSQTRSPSGKPGSGYFQNRSDYKIWVELEPESRKVTGRESVTYTNNSPHTLDKLVVRLYQDIYKKGFFGDYSIDENDRTNGVEISLLAINGDTLS
ncbi:MAG: hypothetical protein KDC85_23580, partial [Saprospiraceae bacterium]|nr:hypothetical protein [Saprospiraceae bacterium]